MSGDVPEFPLRTCPWPGCRATWLEDPHMREDFDICPSCGRDAVAFDYGEYDDREYDFIGKGPGRYPAIILTETGGPLLTESTESIGDRKWILTDHSVS